MEEREERNSLKRMIPDWKPIFYPCTQNNIIEFNKKYLLILKFGEWTFNPKSKYLLKSKRNYHNNCIQENPCRA